MKIEKISDNQIRCTLTKEDLDSHQIRISLPTAQIKPRSFSVK